MATKADLSDYKIVLYVQESGGWVAEVPAIGGCHALMETREQALRELERVFEMIREEYAEIGKPMPVDRTVLQEDVPVEIYTGERIAEFDREEKDLFSLPELEQG